MKLRAALAVTATILAGAVGMGGLSGCALPTGMAGLGNGAGTGLTGTQVADTECHPQLDLAETAFGLWVTAKKIPIQGSSHQFYFTVRRPQLGDPPGRGAGPGALRSHGDGIRTTHPHIFSS